MSSFLAFDLGASSGRAMIGRLENGRLSLTEVHRFANGPTEKDGAIYWDYPQLCLELKNGLRKALAVEPELDGIGIDTWGVDYVFFDKATGKMRRWPYHYRDVRTDSPETDVWNKISKQELYERTGIQCMLLNTVYQLAAHHRMHPEDFKDSFFLTMPDALAYYLGGERTSEYTECSTTNLLDPVGKEWDWEIIDRLGLPRDVFPEIVKPCTFSGTLSEELQKELGCGPVPIIKVGSHDTASAVLAAPLSGRTPYISSGTWSLLGVERPEACTTDEAREKNYSNEGSINGDFRLQQNIMGLWMIQQVRHELDDKYSFDELVTLAREHPIEETVDVEDEKFLAPESMLKAVHSSVGRELSVGATAYCIFNSLAKGYAESLSALEALTGEKYNTLNIIGGGSKNMFLNELTAKYTGKKIITGPTEGIPAMCCWMTGPTSACCCPISRIFCASSAASSRTIWRYARAFWTCCCSS